MVGAKLRNRSGQRLEEVAVRQVITDQTLGVGVLPYRFFKNIFDTVIT